MSPVRGRYLRIDAAEAREVARSTVGYAADDGLLILELESALGHREMYALTMGEALRIAVDIATIHIDREALEELP